MSCSETRVARVVVVLSLMSRRRYSTLISSDSSASITEGEQFGAVLGYAYQFVVSFIWVEGLVRTSLISSTAKYASVGMPTVCGRKSNITITGREMNRLKQSLISWSDARSFGPG